LCEIPLLSYNSMLVRILGGHVMIDNRMASYAAFVLRLTLAFFFFAHVYRKFAHIGFEAWWNGLVKQGYPAWTLAYTVAAEFAGGVLLLLGIYSRYVALFTLPVLIAVANHWAVRRGFWFGDGGAEFPLAWCCMLVTQVLLGDGAFALRVPRLPWERPSAASPVPAQ
jgi:putative oxidoreductase